MKLTEEHVKEFPILIVGRPDENRKLLEQTLLSENYTFDTAFSCKEAAEKANKNHYALILVDVQISDKNDFDLVGLFNGPIHTRDVPILFIVDASEDIANLKHEGRCIDYLFKPVNVKLLKLKVCTFIRLWRQEFELEKSKEKMQNISKNLESLIESKTVELRRKNQDLQQFAYLAAHDLKEPIGNISSLLSMIRDENGIKSESQVLFDKTFLAVEQLEKKIGNLNEVIAVKDKFNLEPEELHFNLILEEVKSNIELDIKGKNAEIKANFNQCGIIHFPRIHLVSILQNLISNSIKYSRNGTKPVIDISTENNNGFICLTVKDNGRGMDLDIYGNKLFKLFQRFHLEEHGRGIGLHLVNEIVENYGGHIDVRSQVNKGTSFRIFLRSLSNN